MIDGKLLSTYENRVSAAMRESDDPIAITANDPAELIEIIRNARRYLVLRENEAIAGAQAGEVNSISAFYAEFDAAADRLLEGGD